MRSSIDIDDQGFMPPTMRNRAVTIDGTPVIGAITADEELGMVRILLPDPKGAAVETILFGTVKLERVH